MFYILSEGPEFCLLLGTKHYSEASERGKLNLLSFSQSSSSYCFTNQTQDTEAEFAAT